MRMGKELIIPVARGIINNKKRVPFLRNPQYNIYKL